MNSIPWQLVKCHFYYCCMMFYTHTHAVNLWWQLKSKHTHITVDLNVMTTTNAFFIPALSLISIVQKIARQIFNALFNIWKCYVVFLSFYTFWKHFANIDFQWCSLSLSNCSPIRVYCKCNYLKFVGKQWNRMLNIFVVFFFGEWEKKRTIEAVENDSILPLKYFRISIY